MNYRVYACNNNYSWELIKIVGEEYEAYNIVHTLNKNVYQKYLIIKSSDRDEILELKELKNKTLKKQLK